MFDLRDPDLRLFCPNSTCAFHLLSLRLRQIFELFLAFTSPLLLFSLAPVSRNVSSSSCCFFGQFVNVEEIPSTVGMLVHQRDWNNVDLFRLMSVAAFSGSFLTHTAHRRRLA